ncbi:MAG: hypothetical protein Fur0022_08420 [Anaerolineales bacterium]
MNRAQFAFILCLLLLFALILTNGLTPPPALATLSQTPEQSAAPIQLTPTFTSPLPNTPTLIPTGETELPQQTAPPLNIPTLPPRDASAPTPTPLPPLTAAQWREWPVIPTIPGSVHAIYEHGLELGNDVTNFSVIGDCQSVPIVFMGSYDQRPEFWPAYDYTNLMPTLAQFQGSFGRRSGAVANGMSAASVFSPFWADLNICQAGETPLECEFRLQRPVIVFINLGTNFGEPEKHEQYLRDIVEYVIAQGAVPVLSTKGDNAEGDWSVNEHIVQLAIDYDLPLWNYWAAIQDLPNHGIDDARPEGNYLTRAAWDVRSITGLQVLDVLWHALQTGG